MMWVVAMLACADGGPRIPDPAADLLAELDRDGSGVVEAAEVPWMAEQGLLGQADADKSGALDREELRAAMEGTFAKPGKKRPARGGKGPTKGVAGQPGGPAGAGAPAGGPAAAPGGPAPR